ncbi:MAG: hypothetical protein AAFX44_06080 [Pseudomonadota bacterium]
MEVITILSQSSATELHEIIALQCSKVLAAPGSQKNVGYSLYMFLGELWLWVFIQAGLLFVDECNGPDPEDDLQDGEDYLDAGQHVFDSAPTITSAVMADDVFRMTFSSGASLMTLHEVSNGTKFFVTT